MRKNEQITTELYEVFSNEKIDFSIKFETDIDTVFDLSYFLVDFQAVVNGLTEILADTNIEEYGIVAQERVDIEDDIFISNIHKSTHPEWQKRIENNIEALFFPEPKAAAQLPVNSIRGFKQTTRRSFNKKYRNEWKVRDFSKGSLILELTTSVLSSVITEFLKVLVDKKTGRNNAITINIQNSVLVISGLDIQGISKNTYNSNTLVVKEGANYCDLDVRKYIDSIIEEANPDQDIEESVKRFLEVLHKNGIITQHTLYDSRGMKTVVRDIERLVESSFDVRV